MLETHGLLVRQRTQAINALPSHLSEFGIIAGMSTAKIAGPVEIVRDETDAALAEGGSLRRVGPRRSEALKEQVDKFEREIVVEAKRNEHMRRLARIPGVGAIMAATIRALVPVPGGFKSGRYFAAWLGLTPKSPGSKTEPVPRKCAPSPPATSPVGPRRRSSHAGTHISAAFGARHAFYRRVRDPHPHATRCLFMVRPQLNTHSGHRAGSLVQHVQHVFCSRDPPQRGLSTRLSVATPSQKRSALIPTSELTPHLRRALPGAMLTRSLCCRSPCRRAQHLCWPRPRLRHRTVPARNADPDEADRGGRRGLASRMPSHDRAGSSTAELRINRHQEIILAPERRRPS